MRMTRDGSAMDGLSNRHRISALPRISAGGAAQVSPARKRWENESNQPSAVGATLSAKHKSRIIFNTVLSQQRNQLRVKVHSPVMRFLISDVPNNGGNIGSTHAKPGIAFLPCEFVSLVIRPARRIRLNREDRLCERERRRNLNQKMDVVVRAADGEDENPVVLADPRDVTPHRRLEFARDDFAAVLRAENDVNHVCAYAWDMCRTYGAWSLIYQGPSASAVG